MNKTERTFLYRAKSEMKKGEELLLLTIAAAILAGLGIALDNVYILLGAMLVAPMFDPIISIVIFLLEQKYRQLLVATATLIIMVIGTIGIAFIVLVLAGEEYRSSTLTLTALPTMTVEYFVVALIMGMVGTSMWVWPKTSNTSAGISTAISLVPPLAHISKGFLLFDGGVIALGAQGFAINLFGIILGSILTFLGRKYWRKFIPK